MRVSFDAGVVLYRVSEGEVSALISVRRCAGVEYELDVAELRNVGEKGRMFSRRNSAAGTARLEAGLAALAGYQIPETTIPEPFIG